MRRRWWTGALAGCLAVALVASLPPARAHEPGLGRVVLRYDPAVARLIGERTATTSTASTITSTGTRATTDRRDLNREPKLHLIYFVPSGARDRALDTKGVLDQSMKSMSAWLDRQTRGRHLRLDMYRSSTMPTPRVDVSFVRGRRSARAYAADGATIDSVTAELASRGWRANPARKRYLVYYEGASETIGVCGEAYFNPVPGEYAQWSMVYLGSVAECGARDFGTVARGPGMSEAIALQELVHNEAIVPVTALHHCSAFPLHVCTAQAGAALTIFSDRLDPESVDVMFPFITFPLRKKRLDPGRDDYFGHPIPLQRDLADSPFLTR